MSSDIRADILEWIGYAQVQYASGIDVAEECATYILELFRDA